MSILIAGIVLFLGAHSLRIFADEWRGRQIARIGEKAWKGSISLVSLAGLALMVWGYSLTRTGPDLWFAPVGLRHLTVLLTMPAFILLVAAYVPGNHIKAALGHPMVAGVKLWAFAHLLVNTRPGDLVLFGAFLAWAIADFIAARRRDRLEHTRHPAGSLGRDAVVVVAGLAVWAAFALFAHEWLTGVRPFR
jgi:uncharacterized membrane protein